MPRCPAKDYADRCRAVELERDGLSRVEIGQALQRPERWVRRALGRYDEHVGVESLRDRSSRPHYSPGKTPVEIEQAMCQMKQAHANWGRRQIAKQLRWQWRDDAARQRWAREGRVRCVLGRHPELRPAVAPTERRPPRQIDYLSCNLIWAADIHQTRLADGSVWETLHWLDLHSRYELGQMTGQCLTEDMVARSFLTTAQQHGLPWLLKTDRDKLFCDPNGLPSLLGRLLAAVRVEHLLMPKRQPWWNGVLERYICTCRQEVCLPAQGDGDQLNQAMEAQRCFYNQQRCHSRCADRPPATCYQPSTRCIPADLDLAQLPLTLQPTILTRQVQASGRVALAGRSLPFSRRYAQQTITVTVDGWSATAQAQDGWQRSWDLHPGAQMPPPAALPAQSPKPLTRKVDLRGCITLSGRLYYLGIAWVRQTMTLQPQGSCWSVSFPDGSSKTLPDPQLLPPRHQPSPRLHTPPSQPPQSSAFQTRRVTKTGQFTFHHRFYYAGIAHRGTNVYVTPVSDGLAVYTTDYAWITTCPWKADLHPDKPLCPT